LNQNAANDTLEKITAIADEKVIGTAGPPAKKEILLGRRPRFLTAAAESAGGRKKPRWTDGPYPASYPHLRICPPLSPSFRESFSSSSSSSSSFSDRRG
jgi:hypothetical protein